MSTATALVLVSPVSPVAAEESSTVLVKRTSKDSDVEIYRSPLSACYAHADDNARRGDVTKGATFSELCETLRSAGQINPIVCEREADGRLRVRAGFRRFAALTHIKATSVLVRVLRKGEDPYIVNLVENMGREEVHPSDVARRISDMVEGKLGRTYTCAQIAKVVKTARGKDASVSYVANLARAWGDNDEAARTAWKAHNLPIDGMIKLAAAPKDDRAQALATMIESKGKRKPRALGAKQGATTPAQGATTPAQGATTPAATPANVPPSETLIRDRIKSHEAKKAACRKEAKDAEGVRASVLASLIVRHTLAIEAYTWILGKGHAPEVTDETNA